MRKLNPDNKRVNRRYLDYLSAAKGYDEATIDARARAIACFEASNGGKSLEQFHIERAKAFRARLMKETSPTTGRPLSKSTVHQTLTALRDFFLWLAGQPGFKRRISYGDADYLGRTSGTLGPSQRVPGVRSPPLSRSST